jgi:hypothetical protein
MHRAVNRSSKRCRTAARDNRETWRRAPTALVSSSTTKPVDAILNQFRRRAAIERNNRRAASHGFDHDEPERLRPVDRDDQRHCAAEEMRFLADNLFWRVAGSSAATFVRVTGDILADLFRHLTGHALSYFAKRMPGVLTSCHVERSLHDRKHVRVECIAGFLVHSKIV